MRSQAYSVPTETFYPQSRLLCGGKIADYKPRSAGGFGRTSSSGGTAPPETSGLLCRASHGKSAAAPHSGALTAVIYLKPYRIFFLRYCDRPMILSFTESKVKPLFFYNFTIHKRSCQPDTNIFDFFKNISVFYLTLRSFYIIVFILC